MPFACVCSAGVIHSFVNCIRGGARKHRHKRKRSASLNPAASPVSSGTSISTVSRSSFSLMVGLTIVLSTGLDPASDLPAVVA